LECHTVVAGECVAERNAGLAEDARVIAEGGENAVARVIAGFEN
jgi:hypothetical protein